MNKQEVYAFLNEKGVPYETLEHKALFTMQDTCDVPFPHPESDAKNLFVRDDKKRYYYLITVRGDKRVDLKKFRAAYGTRSLRFVPAEELREILALEPGSVTPLGLLNDEQRRVQFFLDEDFFRDDGLIGCHPNENTATVFLAVADLIRLIEERGTPVRCIRIEQEETA